MRVSEVRLVDLGDKPWRRRLRKAFLKTREVAW